MQLDRRGLLLGLGAAIAAPAIVHAGNLMPVKRIFIPETWLPCDGRSLNASEYPELAKVLGGARHIPNFGIVCSSLTDIPSQFGTPLQYYIRTVSDGVIPTGGIILGVK